MNGSNNHAFILEQHGGVEQLHYRSLEMPQPRPGEVRVRHHAIGVNFIDTYHRTGLYPLSLPSGIGLEAAGVVDALGEGVTQFSIGDRVAYCGGPLGAYSDYHCVPASSLLALPDAISFEQAAASLLKGLTAAYLLLKTARLNPGDSVLVHAGAGGVGQLLCAWGKHLQLRVIATVGREIKRSVCEQLGCDAVINYRQDDWVAEVKRLTQQRGVDVVYDGVGKDTFEGSLRCLRPRGLMVSFGNASGPVEAFSPLALASHGSLFLTRPTLTDYVRDPEEFSELGQALFEVMTSGVVRPAIGQRLALVDAPKAHSALESGATTGAIVLIPEGS